MKYLLAENQFEPHVRIRKWFYRIAFWLLTLVLLFALVRHSDWRLIFSRINELPIWILLVSSFLWVQSFVFRTIRFQSEWKNFERIPFKSALRATVLHNAAVVLVPFRVGELGYPVLVRQLIKAPWQHCVRSLLWLRFQDAVVLLCFAFLILPLLKFEVRLLILCLSFLILLGTRHWWKRILRSRHFLAHQFRAFLHQRSDAWGWVWSIANWVCKLFAISLLLQSLTDLDISLTLKGALTGELSALLPLTGPAGFGTYEIGVWAGLGLPWSEMSQLMASVLFSHVFFLMISLLLALFFVIADGMKGLHFKFFKSGANV